MQSKVVFHNYLQTRKYLPRFVWHLGRLVSVSAVILLCYGMFVLPREALFIFWDVLIPLLPLVFFVLPGLWRNLCPLAASNQLPRLLGFSLGKELPEALRRYAGVIGMSLLFGIVPLRKLFLQDDAYASALLLISALACAFTGGVIFKGKSGWCGSFCPILPLQRAYGQTPFLTISNSHCKPCVACTKNCYDFNPQVAYLADLYDNERHLGGDRKFFIAALPGFLYAFFNLPNVPQITALALYQQIGFYMLMSIGGFYVLETYIKVSVHKLTALFTLLCLNIFYWYVLPGFIDALLMLIKQMGLALPETLSSVSIVWVLRGLLLVLGLWWLFKTFSKEVLFLGQALAAQVTRVPKNSLSQRGGKPEIVLMPQSRNLAVDANKSILEGLESHNVSIESGCRMGVCGADPVAIVEGMENLSEVGQEERATLERLGYAGNTRMACSAKVCGTIKVSLTPERGAPPAIDAPDFTADQEVKKVVILGNGIAGVTAADYIRRYHADCEIHIVGSEKHPLYNRMGISRLIYGRSAMQGLYLLPDEWYEQRRISTWLNTRAVSIDFNTRAVMLATDKPLQYDRLILALGSPSYVPTLKGFGMPGTFVLRCADDAMNIRAYAQENRAQTAVVAGGGLLGLETAYALIKLGLRVTVLERSEHLLKRQLDKQAAAHLQAYLQTLGIETIHDVEVSSAAGANKLETVYLKGRKRLSADILVVAAGVKANLELLRNALLTCARGVKVDAAMRTSLPDVYAAGDLAEPESGQMYGLWPVAVEQGRIAGINAIGGRLRYREQPPVTLLKVVGVELTSVGVTERQQRGDLSIVFADAARHCYRKLILRDQFIIGVILLGYPQYAQALINAMREGRRFSDKQVDALQAGDWEVLTQPA